MPYSSFGLGLIQSWGYEFVCSAAEHETTVGNAARLCENAVILSTSVTPRTLTLL